MVGSFTVLVFDEPAFDAISARPGPKLRQDQRSRYSGLPQGGTPPAGELHDST
jgi:hypothetical protein